MYKYIITLALLPLSVLATTGVVVKVVDGDTIKIASYYNNSNYRLAGIDTPETYNNRKAKKDIINCGIDKQAMFKLGKAATEYVRSKYKPNDMITYTIVDTGYYGRPIIYIPELNIKLVKLGYARVVDYGNLPQSVLSHLHEAENYAIANNLGIWKKLSCWK